MNFLFKRKEPQVPAPSQDEWQYYQSEYDNINSRVCISKDFTTEAKANARKLHFNKKNTTRNSRYYKDIQAKSRNGVALADSDKVNDHIFETSLPNAVTYTHEGLGSRIYNCKFTSDGSRLLVTSQNGTSFFKFGDDGQVELNKVITCFNINWTITDSDISTDNRFMVHSTLSPYVHMFDVNKAKYCGQFNLKTGSRNDDDEHTGYSWFYNLRIYSLKLSQDNKEIIAGCGRTGEGAPIQVFDLETSKVTKSIVAHKEDINSVCYVDKKNSSIFISGSDDGLCKVWDTRILKDNQPVGIYYGHVSGLTHVSSKEDNRYFISNCKDQSIKLWDLRKCSNERRNITLHDYDYRYGTVSQSSLDTSRAQMRNSDQSVMTFLGHQVHMTLIRCHFSPLHATGQRYIYSGSYDGKVYVYDTITGKNIMKLELPSGGSYSSNSVVRDCAWHPYSQNFISTSFHGEIHKWEHLDLRDAERIGTKTMAEPRTRRTRNHYGSYDSDEDDDNATHGLSDEA